MLQSPSNLLSWLTRPRPRPPLHFSAWTSTYIRMGKRDAVCSILIWNSFIITYIVKSCWWYWCYRDTFRSSTGPCRVVELEQQCYGTQAALTLADIWSTDYCNGFPLPPCTTTRHHVGNAYTGVKNGEPQAVLPRFRLSQILFHYLIRINVLLKL